jgi:hypothetical protein
MSDKYPGGFVTTGAPAGFSVAFDGTGDYLTIATNAALQLGTGAFTVECWYNSTLDTDGILSCIDNGSGSFGIGFYFSNTTTLKVAIQSNVTEVIGYTTTVAVNNWYHVAAVRDGSNNYAVFVNGVRIGSTTNTTNISLGAWGIGRTYANSGTTYGGYISNVRIVKGTAVYDPTQTTLRTPTQLFPITNTSLLTCQSPTIIDNSTNAFTVTANGDAKVSNFTPFAGYTGFNPALGAAAGGVWTLDEAAYYQNNRIWPIYDPYFNQTTLMLHGNGANAANNSVFLDSSTNNFAITRAGNTTQGTFTPFSQTGWSNYFNGSSSYISAPSSSVYNVGASAFCIEMWFNAASFSSQQGLFSWSVSLTGLEITIETSGQISISLGTGSSWILTNQVAGAITANAWNHVAYVRSSGTLSVFINGTRTYTVANSSTVGNANTTAVIGSNRGTAAFFTGYVSNFRFINGSTPYDPTQTGITVPTAPINVVTGTSLLTAQSNRFVDASANAFSITPSGTPSVQAFSPFVPTVTTPTTYSNYFDGTGDYLSSSSANYTATGDFTAEAWFYATSNPSFGGIINTRPQSNTTGWAINLDSSQKIRFYINGTDFPAGYTSYNLNQWYHVALVRSGSTVTGYVNGISVGTTTNSSTTTTTDLVIGRFYSDLDNYYLNGVVSNARFVNGTALYTTNFTPPNAPFPTGTTNQQLLTCQASTLIDSNTYTTAKTITANGNVRPVSSPTPFPAKVDQTTLNSAYSTSLIGGSGYFDGTGDYLNSTITALGDFTVECWAYFTTAASKTILTIGDGATTSGFELYTNSSSYIVMGNSTGSVSTSPTTLKANQWYYFAATRSGSTITAYVNGVSIGTANMGSTTLSTTIRVGVEYYSSTLAQYFTGYIGSLRISNTVRTGLVNSAPIAPYTSDANTVYLLNYTNGGIFDNTAKNVLETVGNAQISTTQSKWGGSSLKSAASTDYLTGKSIALGGGDFTIECWVYPTSFPGSQNAVLSFGTSDLTSTCIVYLGSAGQLAFYNNSIVATSTSTASANTWTHITIVRVSGTVKLFVNGIQDGSGSNSNNISDVNLQVFRGFGGITTPIIGYIDDLRITKGVARYTTNFTPPTSQLQDQ